MDPAAGTQRLDFCPSVEPFLTRAGELYLLPTADREQRVVRAPLGAWVWNELGRRGAQAPAGRPARCTDPDADGREQVAAAIAQLRDEGLVREVEAPDGGMYDRQQRYFAQCGLDPEAVQRELAEARVLVLGLGGVGGGIAEGLLRAGVGTVVGVDCDPVEAVNIPRQPLSVPRDVGRRKSDVARVRLAQVAPDANVIVEDVRIDSAARVRDLIVRHRIDLMACCADSPPLSIKCWVDDAAFAEGVPVMLGGQRPPYLYVGPLIAPGHSVCFGCFGHGEEAPERHALIAELDAWRDSGIFEIPGLGYLDLVVASMMVGEMLAWITGSHTNSLIGREVEIDARTYAPRWIEAGGRGCARCSPALEEAA